jgi:AraC family transcriptional regulator, regulatory protein of adaptative response / methylated-DNA-[protein]-cysteine methyltransferase
MEKNDQLFYDTFPTPLGTMIAAGNINGIAILEFTDIQTTETGLLRIQKESGSIIIPGINPIIEKLKYQLNEYFDGKLRQFDLQLNISGTPFQQNVWKKLQEIPYGETWSYQEQATALGNPNSVRAVAKANGSNMIAIVIPCHRVIGKNGQLTGYSGGLWRKTWLLDHERTVLKG